jgi:peptide deformylase
MIIINNENAIRLKCEDLQPKEVGELIELLERELENSAKMGRPGIGLAAPQIGIAKNIAIVRPGNKEFNINLVNCSIQNKYDEFIFRDEGCLSFPGRVENTKRFNEIHVINNLVYPYNFIATGLIAVVCQHELDHLNGVLLTDSSLKTQKVKVRPNDKCVCGSGLKFKKCCSNLK